MKNEHLIFYDGDCAFCNRAVRILVKSDEEGQFLFAPLEGETASEILIGPNAHFARADSLILVEAFRSDRRAFWIRSQAVFRIYWLMGSYWIGWLCFMPPFLTDWAYRIFAKHRHRIRFGVERPEYETDRFLP